ncbi:hypothetical protein D3C81_614700 [compost metagenome]
MPGGRRSIFGLPAALGLAEAQAQAVVVLHQAGQGSLQYPLIQRLARLQQNSLVPVLRLWHFTVEEPVLDRREAGLALALALFDAAGGFAALNDGGQGVDGLMLEQVARGELQAGLTSPADHLDRQDRVAAQFEEVVLHADPGNVEHIAPDLRQLRFHLVARRLVLLACLFQVRQRQRTAVELAVAHQRQAVEQHQVRRHHVVRQVLAGIGFHRVAQQALGLAVGSGLPAHQVTHQLLAAGQVEGQHHSFVDIGMRLQAAFDFAQLDTETANLHLLVGAADVLDQAIAAQAHQVTGAIQAPAFAAERVGDEALGTEARAVVVTLGQASTADIQLANTALRQQGKVFVEDVGRAATDDAADRYAAQFRRQRLRCQAGQRHDHRFGRPVGVEELLRREGLADALQVFTGQRFTTGNDQAHWQLLALPGQVLRQLAAVAGREAEDAHLLLAHQLADVFGAPLPLGAQHHAGATQQRHPQAFAGGVEIDRIEVQLAVIAAHAERVDHRLAMHGELAVADYHALGLAGGTGGVDQVGLVLRQVEVVQRRIAVGRQAGAVVLQAPARHTLGQLAQGLQQRALAEQQADAAVFDHVAQAVERVFGVERHVGATGLEDGQQADDHFQRTLQRQAHTHLRADATLAQGAGQAVGLLVEFGIGHVPAGEGQRASVWRARSLGGEQAVHGLVECEILLALQLARQHLLLGAAQHRQLAQALLRVVEQARQQLLPVLGHACDAWLVEQVTAVGQAATQAAVEVGHLQVQVELGGAGVVDQVIHLHAGQAAALLEGPALHVAHHLEQRVVGAAARWLQGFHQLVERQVLVRLAFDGNLAYLLQQLCGAHLAVQLATQHLGVEKRANQPFAFRADAVGHRRANAQVTLAAVAVQQGGQGGSHGHEQGQAALAVEGMHAGDQRRVELEAVQLATVALHCRARAVGRQRQYWVFIAQTGLPVGQLAGALAAFQPLPLPHAVVQVLHRQRRQRRFAVIDEGLVQLAQFAGEDVHGPALGDDMVQGQHEEVLALFGFDQAGAQQRTALQVERLVRLVVGQLLQALLAGIGGQGAEVLPVEVQAAVFGHALIRHAIDAGEGGAQGFVAHHQRLQRTLEGIHMQGAAQARHAADVVRRAARLHLPEEPHALLRVRQRHCLAAVDAGDCALQVALTGSTDTRDLGTEGAQLAGVEQGLERQLDIAGLTRARNNLSGQQRMAAEGEEVILQADARQVQHLAPDGGDLLLQLGLRLDVLPLLPHRGRQRLAVDLAAGAQRHLRQRDELCRHHVGR